MENKIYKSFEEWSNLGYKITKGSKATWKNNKPVFNIDQVVKTSYSKGYHYETDSDEEEDSIYYYLAPNHW